MIRYERTFRFSASHYGPWHHAIVRKAEETGSISWHELQALMARLHGHNFRVDISLDYDENAADVAAQSFGVWDETLEGWIKEWHNCNISMHPDLYGPEWVSSTEHTALVLARKILSRCPEHVLIAEVTLWETDDIKTLAHAVRGEVEAARTTAVPEGQAGQARSHAEICNGMAERLQTARFALPLDETAVAEALTYLHDQANGASADDKQWESLTRFLDNAGLNISWLISGRGDMLRPKA